MSFSISHDYFDNVIVPPYILCKANKERIGILKCTSKTVTPKFNALDEITFTTYMYNDEILNPFYDDVVLMKYILIPDVGFYQITDVEVKSEGSELEYKDVTAQSYECGLAQKYLDTFVINYGTDESIDGVSFYNMANPEASLLDLVLSECPDWKIGHVDESLKTMQRSFEVSLTDVYTFLTDDVSTAFECIFIFDTLNNTISAYTEDNVGENTNIYISYNNLLESVNISCDLSEIKTCLTLTGDDDLTVREINMGYDKIYNFDYYNSTEYMSESLYNAYNKWVVKRNSNVNQYTSLLSQYQQYYMDIADLTNNKMPETSGSTDWTEYGLVPLQEQLAIYERQQSVMMKAGWGEEDNKNYESRYLPIYNTIVAINAQLDVINAELDDLKSKQSAIYSKMSAIINDVSMNNNFTVAQMQELTAFIRQDELTSDNFVVTDAMTDEERFEMLDSFLEYGEKELAKVAMPQMEFKADVANLFVIPEFQAYNGSFDVGNYIYISLRDDYKVKLRLLTMTYDFMDVTNFSVTFGNVAKVNGELVNITEAISQAQSAATSVSFNASYWSEAAKETSTIGKIIDEGLLSQGKYLKSGDNSEMVIDDRGIFVKTISGDYKDKDSIFMGGGRILFTQDNWKTVAMSVGRADVTIKGVTASRFGTFADFVLAGYVGASVVEGDEIIGGTIRGTDFRNGGDTFIVDSEGNLTAESANVKGTIRAEEGYIGGENGFTIKSQKLYSGKDSFSNSSDGVYVGTDGIALGKDNVFTVDKNGNLTAESGIIGGYTITATDLYNNNDSEEKSAGIGKYGTSYAFWAGSTYANRGSAPFRVGHEGHLYASSETIEGDITANTGYIGGKDGFVITTNKIYNGKSTGKDNNSDGIYIGTDGIYLGKNNVFWVDSSGTLTAQNVAIKGIVDATSGSIGNFTINKALYTNNKSSLGDTRYGVYIGSDGISLGDGFRVTSSGYMTVFQLEEKSHNADVWNQFSDSVYDTQTRVNLEAYTKKVEDLAKEIAKLDYQINVHVSNLIDATNKQNGWIVELSDQLHDLGCLGISDNPSIPGQNKQSYNLYSIYYNGDELK
jgi:hypothetical protein